MGRPKTFLINLVGNNPVYFPGSNIEGNVSLELSEPKKMQGISIILSGQAYVHWTEQRTHDTEGGERRTETIHHSDSETILNSLMIQLWGDGKHSQELAAGRYSFPFKYQLPSNLVLPTSYESQTGFIRYSLTATISRSWKFNHTTKRAITINEIIDINTPQLTARLSSSNEKTLCCLCCASGPISLSVTTDRGGYCSGESIAISTEAENHSNRRITVVQATLKQIVVYYARGHSDTSVNVIQKVQGPGIEAGGTSNWSNELLPIPATVPCIDSCRILKVSYILQVTLAIPRSSDLNVTIPIRIGNVPFRRAQPGTNPPQANYPPPNNPYPPPAGNAYPPPNNVPPTGNPYPPPVYNYSATYPPVNIGDDQYTMGETQYAPVYGFVTDYRFVPPPS